MKEKVLNPIWRRRVLAGMSQVDLAGRVGMTKQAISNLENCVNDPSYRSLVDLATVFKVRPGTLLNEYHDWRQHEQADV